MRLVRYNESMLDECAEFWWSIYKDMPYIHRPDGITLINVPPIGPEYFVKILKAGLSGARYWATDWGPKEGVPCARETTDDSIILAEDDRKLAGILVSSTQVDKRTGDIMSCYIRRDLRGRAIADRLLNEALERFRKMGLRRAVASPGAARSMEVESPIHLAILDAGFAWKTWESNWQPACVSEQQYSVFLGGSLEGFRLQPEIQEKREKLRKEGIDIKRVTWEEFHNLRRYDTGGKVDTPLIHEGSHGTFVALVDGFTVGWLSELGISDDDPSGVVTGGAVPEVIPIYQRRGIGKVLYHLGIDEVVRQGARYGWTGTGIYNPARLIYRSIGYRYWCTVFGGMTKRLR